MSQPSATTYFLPTEKTSRVMKAELTHAKDGAYLIVHTAPSLSEQPFLEIAEQAGNALQLLHSLTQEDGSHLVMVKITGDSTALINALNNHGCSLQEPPPEKEGFNPWKWRGITSIVGQSLQIASSLTSGGSASDRNAIFGFAALNLAANICNMTFGGQHNPDTHQLALLKTQYNQAIAPFVANPDALPSVDANPLEARTGESPAPTFTQTLYDTARHYSVSVGEVGLRTLGAISLSFPITQWGEAANKLKEGDVAGAFLAAKNTNDVTFQAGLATIAGKFISMSAKEKDPYNPEPRSVLDGFREEMAFKLSSVVEAGATTYMLADRANLVGNVTHKPTVFGQPLEKDYFGMLGNATFIGGYGIRFTAPYGSLDVDMPQLYAHISDCLQHVPPESLPAALLASAARMKQHFADAPISFTEMYSKISEDLQKHHGINVADYTDATRTQQTSSAPIIPYANIMQPELHGVTTQEPALARA